LNAPAVSSTRDTAAAEEWALRVDLAAAYRLVALFGWDDLIFTHISARVPGRTDHFLINPYGLLFEEITASNLVKIDLQANVVEPTSHLINRAGFVIHSAIHAARADARCIVHTHTIDGIAVSVQRSGLLPLSNSAFAVLDSLAYHEYEGRVTRDEERHTLVADLGRKHNLILRNHGLLTLGETVAGAFVRMFCLATACTIQIRAQSTGEPLALISEQVLNRDRGPPITPAETRVNSVQLTWSALLRRLDRLDPSFRD